MELREPYQPRLIEFVELATVEGWRLKVYNIRHRDKKASHTLFKAAKTEAAKILPQPVASQRHHGVGFLSVHQGKSYDFVTVAWWAYETELYQQTYLRPSSLSADLEPLSGLELSSDVWDLRLLAFERDAWLAEVLTRPGSPSLEAYLAQRLTETV